MTAGAQAPAPADAAKKDKQEMVKSTTEGAQKQQAVKAAEGSAAAAKTQNTPKALPDKKAKQQAAKASTEAAQPQSAVKSAEGSTKAAADTSPRVPPPKPNINQPELKKAATP
jgi:hypothetical protein